MLRLKRYRFANTGERDEFLWLNDLRIVNGSSLRPVVQDMHGTLMGYVTESSNGARTIEIFEEHSQTIRGLDWWLGGRRG